MRRTDLPIFEIEPRLLAAMKSTKRLVLTAPTGSGKSTQVPQMLLDAGLLGDQQIVVLQPRRLATCMLARWVAESRGAKLGGEVGYQMRLDNMTSPATRICYATEGVVLRRMLADPELKDIAALVFDEFHERHLYGDITLGRALEIQQSSRPDLIIVVMSATLDVAAVEKYLAPCATLSSEGRAYPVALEYLAKPAANTPVWELAVRELTRVVREDEGDALVFMPGAYEIGRTIEAARAALGNEFAVLPLYGELPPREQDAAVSRTDRRKVVVATNVAETSLTIEGIRVVVDSGLARIPRYDPYRGINTLLIEKISRASAEQRTGRAGRTAPGHCLRLWTAHEQAGRPAQELPEVKRLDLAEVILTLKAGGVTDVKKFRWLEPPEPRALERAEALLADLGAISGTGAITALGRRMLAFPAHPRYARMLLAGQDLGCVREVALIAALTQGRDLLMRRQGEEMREELSVGAGESDFFVLMRAWRYAERNGFDTERCRRAAINAQAARQVGPLFEQFLSIARPKDLPLAKGETKRGYFDIETAGKREAIQRAVLLGFSDHVAKRVDSSERCDLVHGRRGVLARDSIVKASLFAAAEIRELQKGTTRERGLSVILSLATAIKPEWLREFFPDDVKQARTVAFDAVLKRAVARTETRFRDLAINQEAGGDATPDEAAPILAREIAVGNLSLEHWDESVEEWILRVNRLREWMPELELPAIGAEDRAAIVEHLCHGATSYGEIRNRPVLPIAKSWLSHQQQAAIDEYAPERIKLPGGRSVKIAYSADAPPTIAARIQDLYGVKDGFSIAKQRVPVRIQILAPSNRPLQVTDNLALFWRETYPKLKPQLQRRYPKHEWR
jgi:ATP-dependent helicase HrpB